MATETTIERNILGFRSGMHKSCTAYAEAALALRLLPLPAQQTALVPLERSLAARQLLALPDAPLTLRCLGGELWLTRDGDVEDYILGHGRSFTVRPGDRAVVQALKPSRLQLLAA